MPADERDALRQLQSEIEGFITSLQHPVVVEDEIELFDLSVAQWRLTSDLGKLIFEVWNPARSIARRVEEIAYRDQGCLGVFVRKPGARTTTTLELRELHGAARRGPVADRARFGRQLLSLLAERFSGWKVERVSNRSDREHSFSGIYTRGLACQGRTAWAFLGLGEGESPSAADGALAYGLIWLDWLRGQAERVTVSGLKLFLPAGATEATAHRARYLNQRALAVEIYECTPSAARVVPIDLRDYGNVQTRLVSRHQGEMLLERHRERVRQLLAELAGRVDVAVDSSGSFLSLRVLGLEVARVEGHLAPRIYYGCESDLRRLRGGEEEELRNLVRQVVAVRNPHSRDRAHPYYRLQPERWLESLLVKDVTRVDPALAPEWVYPQVPAFSGSDRGVIDILTTTRAGRLAVVELKVEEEINLPLQGLDYWLRVKWLHERKQFREFGYFPGCELADAAPLLYLVSPAFRFHSTTPRLIRYFDPSIEMIQLGLNEGWREGIKVLFRRNLRGGK